MPKFIVETLNTFHEVHVIEAESAEQAQEIAQHTDYNASVWLGTTNVDTQEYDEVKLQRWKEREPYFFEGYAVVEDGYLIYRKMNGEMNGSMPKYPINFKKSA